MGHKERLRWLLEQKSRWNFKHWFAIKDHDLVAEVVATATLKKLDREIDELSVKTNGVCV